MFVLPKAIYWLSEISINIRMAYFTRKQILKFLWNHKTTWIVKIILKKNKAGAITLIDFKLQLTLERCRGWETQLKVCNLSFALHIHCSSTSAESTNLELCSTVVFTTEKTNKKQKPCISGPTQFEPMLFKGQIVLQRYNNPEMMVLA